MARIIPGVQVTVVKEVVPPPTRAIRRIRFDRTDRNSADKSRAGFQLEPFS